MFPNELQKQIQTGKEALNENRKTLRKESDNIEDIISIECLVRTESPFHTSKLIAHDSV